MTPRLFAHGDLRLYLLKLLDEEPRHGYELITSLEDRFMGLYSPSPGTIYPRLQALEEEGLISSSEEGGRKTYRLTDAGREELRARAEELAALGDKVARTARDMARDIREEVRSSVRELRREVKDAARDVRREERRVGRGSREDVVVLKGAHRSLQADLQAFVADVVAAARRHRLDRERLDALRDALLEARAGIVAALEGRPSDADETGDRSGT